MFCRFLIFQKLSSGLRTYCDIHHMLHSTVPIRDTRLCCFYECTLVRLTSIVLHASVMRDSLRPEAEAQDVSGVRTVPNQKRSVRLPLQLHLGILPVHRTPVPTALRRNRHNLQLPEKTRLTTSPSQLFHPFPLRLSPQGVCDRATCPKQSSITNSQS